MREKRASYACGKSAGGFCGEILRRYRGAEPDDTEYHEKSAHFCYIRLICVRYSYIDYPFDYERDAELENRFESFEYRSEYALFAVAFHIF